MVLSIYLIEGSFGKRPHQPYFVAKKMDKKLIALIVVHVDVGDGAWVCQSNHPL